MGEYATRKSDGQEIKIGTCESMYYLRYEDRAKVRHLSGNVNPVKDAGELRFRLPFPDEDGIQPGEYEDYNRGQRLYRYLPCQCCKGEPTTYKCIRCDGSGCEPYADQFSDPSTTDDPGIMQLRHEASGLILNVPCYHGEKLPDVVKPMQAFWNGKGHSLELFQLRPVRLAHDDGTEYEQVFPVVRCRHCNHAWRYTWADVIEFVPQPLRSRLEQYVQLEQAD